MAAVTHDFTHLYEVTLNTATNPPTVTIVAVTVDGLVVLTNPTGNTIQGGTSTSTFSAGPSPMQFHGYGFFNSGNGDHGLIYVDNATGKLYLASDITVTPGNIINVAQDNQAFLDTPSTWCFFPGTRIAVPGGETAVEDLKIGDTVLTAEGEERRLRWVGRQTVSAFFGASDRVLPVRIMAGALGDDLPQRDLLVSPDHALLVDEVLVHASALINGRTIVQETEIPLTFTYYHLETDDHALVLAEGAPAETFIDNVTRRAFDNWVEYESLYPEGKEMKALDVPRVKFARQLPQVIRRRLDAIADRLVGKVAQAA